MDKQGLLLIALHRGYLTALIEALIYAHDKIHMWWKGLDLLVSKLESRCNILVRSRIRTINTLRVSRTYLKNLWNASE